MSLNHVQTETTSRHSPDLLVGYISAKIECLKALGPNYIIQKFNGGNHSVLKHFFRPLDIKSGVKRKALSSLPPHRYSPPPCQ